MRADGPFITAIPPISCPQRPVLNPGELADDGSRCSSDALASGCLQVISVNQVNPAAYTIDYVRYWIAESTSSGEARPTLFRSGNTYTCSSAAASPAFACTIDATSGIGQVAEGIEDFRLFWFDGANWRNWESNDLTAGDDRRIGIYLRGRAIEPDLDRQYPYNSVDIDLPNGVDPAIAGTFDPRFRRIEKWLDIALFNPQV